VICAVLWSCGVYDVLSLYIIYMVLEIGSRNGNHEEKQLSVLMFTAIFEPLMNMKLQ
jgi:hypothetical protein